MLVETVVEAGGNSDIRGCVTSEPYISPLPPHDLPQTTPTAVVLQHILADLNARYATTATTGAADEDSTTDDDHIAAAADPDPNSNLTISTPWPPNMTEYLNASAYYHDINRNDGESAQRRAGRHINRHVFQQHIDNVIDDEHHTIRLISQAQRGAGRSTAVSPSDDNTSLNNDEFRFAVLERIGIHPFAQFHQFNGTEPCPFCPTGSATITPSHVAKCMGLGSRLYTHDKVVAILLQMCKDLLPHATLYSDKQLRGMFPTIGGQHPDLMIEWNDGRRPLILDFTTVEYDTTLPGPLAAAAAGERRKDNHMPYVRMAEHEQLRYVGIAMEPSGAPGPNFQSVLGTIYAAAKHEDPGAPSEGIPALADFTTVPHVTRAQYTPNWILPNRFKYWLTALDAACCKGRYRAQRAFVREYHKLQATPSVDGRSYRHQTLDGTVSLQNIQRRQHTPRTLLPGPTPLTIQIQAWFANNHPNSSQDGLPTLDDVNTVSPLSISTLTEQSLPTVTDNQPHGLIIQPIDTRPSSSLSSPTTITTPNTTGSIPTTPVSESNVVDNQTPGLHAAIDTIHFAQRTISTNLDPNPNQTHTQSNFNHHLPVRSPALDDAQGLDPLLSVATESLTNSLPPDPNPNHTHTQSNSTHHLSARPIAIDDAQGLAPLLSAANGSPTNSDMRTSGGTAR
jgi:hypothetical protein